MTWAPSQPSSGSESSSLGSRVNLIRRPSVAGLYELFSEGHYDAKPGAAEIKRLAVWLDSNTVFYGQDANIHAQAAGQIVQPPLE